MTCDKPALVQAMAEAMPIGPAPIIATSNFSMNRKFLILSQCPALISVFCFRSFKSKMSLGEIAENDDDACCAYFSDSGIKSKLLYKKFEENIVQHNTHYY
jgi:hypothetical protein